MHAPRRNRGVIAPAVLLIAAAGFLGFAQGSRTRQPVVQEQETILPDPAAQRRAMIASLEAMQARLENMDKTLAGIERIAGAQLRLQFDAHKERKGQGEEPKETTQ